MSKTSFSVAQARDLIIAVATVSALDTRPMIFPKVQHLDAGSLTLLAQTFDVATGEDPDVYDNSITDAIMEVFAAARYTTPVFALHSFARHIRLALHGLQPSGRKRR